MMKVRINKGKNNSAVPEQDEENEGEKREVKSHVDIDPRRALEAFLSFLREEFARKHSVHLNDSNF